MFLGIEESDEAIQVIIEATRRNQGQCFGWRTLMTVTSVTTSSKVASSSGLSDRITATMEYHSQDIMHLYRLLYSDMAISTRNTQVL